MINLLPQEEKKQLRSEYWLRFGVVLFSAVFILEVFTLLVFVPTYYALITSTGDLAKNIAERKKFTPTEDANIERGLASIKKELAIFAPAAGSLDALPSVLLEEIILQKTRGIELTAFAYLRGDKPMLQLSGTAETQEDLLAFRRNVQQNPHVLEFKYGSSFITQRANIPFSATINFK